MTFVRRYPLLSFYLIAFAFTWSLAVPLALSRRHLIGVSLPEWLEILAAFGPLVAATIVAAVLSGRAGPRRILRGFVHWRVGRTWSLFAVLSPVGLLILAVAGVSLIGGSVVDADRGQFAALATGSGLFELVVVGGIVQGWGEEPGWRGFALPRLLARLGPLAATLWLFPFWLCWHLPSFLSRPEFGWGQWAAFSVGILSAAVWLSFIWQGTQSILMAAAWHAMVNICRGIALAASMTLFLAISNAVLAGAILIVVFWLLSRRRPVAQG